jgi:tetratricopeptide (TPR) repeat protein
MPTWSAEQMPSRPVLYVTIFFFCLTATAATAAQAAASEAPQSSKQKKSSAPLFTDEISLVQLLDPSDKEAAEHAYGRYLLIPWKAGEKEEFKRVLTEVAKCAPGLITRASSGRHLHVCRVTDLPFNATTAGSFDAEALTRPDSILIPDIFFEGSRRAQLRCILHELVHSADMAGQIALSREWIRFAQPTISELRCESTFGKPERRAGRVIPPHNAWPTLYGCENLTEALAEYFAADAVGSDDFKFDPEFRQVFAARLMRSSKKHAQFLSIYKQGSKLYNEHKYDQAIEKLLEARRLHASAPGTHSCLAACYAYKGDYQTCLKYVASANKHLKRSGVPDGEPDQIVVLEVQGLSYLQTGKLDAAIAAFDGVLGHEPQNNWARSLRARCRESQNKYADAAYDMAAIYGKRRRLIDPLLAARADTDFTMKCLNSNIEKTPKDHLAIQKRAEFVEFLGDKSTDKCAQKDSYLQALADFEKSLAMAGCDRARALAACARLRLKLGEDRTAQDLCDQVMAIEPFNIEAKIIRLSLIERSGNIKDARTEYDELKSQIKRAVPPRHDRQHMPDRLKSL